MLRLREGKKKKNLRVCVRVVAYRMEKHAMEGNGKEAQ